MNLTFKNNHSGFKYLKSEILETLVPVSKIEKDSSIKIQMPIFYHVKNEKFCTFLPDEFLKDINMDELLQERLHANTLQEEGNSYFFFIYDDLKQLRSAHLNENNLYSKIKNKYETHLMDITKGQEVIVIAFKNEQKSAIFSKENNHLIQKFKDSVTASSSRFEFFKAYKFNQKYYLVNKDGTLDQNLHFNMTENTNMNHLVIPYTQEDWELVTRVHDKIKEIKNNIKTIFTHQEQTDLLDKPFSQGFHPLLQDYTKKIKP